ncbi:MAG: c-type cytochrome [Gammaproteobacteria bacterium]|jgi:mono/diheme cytochrome c family protein
MKNVKGYIAARFLLVTLFLPFSLNAQQAFPEGEGRDIVFVSCSQCHGLGHLTRVSLNASQWENALYDMLARGAVVDAKDLKTVRNYLVNNLAVDK